MFGYCVPCSSIAKRSQQSYQSSSSLRPEAIATISREQILRRTSSCRWRLWGTSSLLNLKATRWSCMALPWKEASNWMTGARAGFAIRATSRMTCHIIGRDQGAGASNAVSGGFTDLQLNPTGSEYLASARIAESLIIVSASRAPPRPLDTQRFFGLQWSCVGLLPCFFTFAMLL